MKASASVVVEQPIERVFAFVSDAENMDEWVDGVSDPRRLSDGDVGVGAVLASDYTYRGNTYEIEYEVTEYDPPTRFAMESTEGPFPFRGSLDLERADGGTRITNTIDAGSDSPATTVIFTVLGPVVRRLMRRQLAGELRELAATLEEDDETPAVDATVRAE